MIVECDNEDHDDDAEDGADNNADDAKEDAALDLERVVGPELVGPGPITCSNQRGVGRWQQQAQVQRSEWQAVRTRTQFGMKDHKL